MSTERLELAEWAYQGEVSGEELFAGLRDAESNTCRRAQFEVLRLLESQTAALLRDFVEHLGGMAEPSDKARGHGQRMAEQARHLTRTALLESFAAGTTAAIAKYQRLGMLVDGGDQTVVDQVIAHEEALQAFADASLGGESDPTGPIVAQLHGAWLVSIPDHAELTSSQAD